MTDLTPRPAGPSGATLPARDGWILGVDIGGTKIALGLADASGALRERERRPTQSSGDPERDVARLADECRGLLARAGVALEDVTAVGLSVPGPIDPERGAVVAPPNLPGWQDVPVAKLLEQALGRPVHLENDANAAALAEWHFGAGQGSRHLVYLTMSTGVGGGLVLDGRIYRGAGANAGEVGHAPIEWEGAPCACGMRGCLEAYIGGAAWTRRLQSEAPEDSGVARLAGGRQHASPEHVVAAAREGDDYALAEMARFNDYLARGISQLAFVLAPEVVVLGTIAVAAGEDLCLAPVRRQVLARCWPVIAENLRIVGAVLGAELPYRAGIAAALSGLEVGDSA